MLHKPEDVDKWCDDAVGECGAEGDERKRRRRPGAGEQAREVGRPAGEEWGDDDGGRFDGAALLAREHRALSRQRHHVRDAVAPRALAVAQRGAVHARVDDAQHQQRNYQTQRRQRRCVRNAEGSVFLNNKHHCSVLRSSNMRSNFSFSIYKTRRFTKFIENKPTFEKT